MKTFIAILSVALLISLALFIGWERSWDSRCEYYRSLDMTDTMKELCPEK